MKAIADEVGFLRPANTVSRRDAAEPEQDGAQLPPLTVHDRDDAVVVSLRGELDFSGVSALQACLTDSRWQERALCVTDLSGLAFLDCACLSVLVGHCKRVRGRGGSFALAGPQRAVLRLLSATGLLTWFEVYDTVDEAIASGPLPHRSTNPPCGRGAQPSRGSATAPRGRDCATTIVKSVARATPRAAERLSLSVTSGP